MRRNHDEPMPLRHNMNARNQLLVVVTALMLVCSSGAAMSVTASPPAAGEHQKISDDVDEADDNVTDGADNVSDGADDNVTDDDNETGAQSAWVTFEDQTSDGQTVVVDEVTMASGGFVAIHNSSLLVGDALGSVIGTSEYLEPGTHEDVEITLDEPLEESETLIAMPHRDTNNNEEFDFVELEGQQDTPYLTPEGEPVTDQAVVTLETDDGEDNVTAVDDEDNVTAVDDEDNVTAVDDEDNVTAIDDEDNVTAIDDEDNVTAIDDEEVDEEPVEPPAEVPEEFPAEQPIVVFVGNVSVEDVTIEELTVVVVTDDEIDEEGLEGAIQDALEDEEEVVTDEEEEEDEFDENVTDDEEEEDEFDENVTDDEEEEDEFDENVTDDEEEEDEFDENVTDDEEEEDEFEDDVTDEDNVTEDEFEEAPTESFTVEDFDAPDSAEVGDVVNVSATITNPGDTEDTQDVEFRLEGDLVASESITLEGGESTTITFEVDTSGVEAGEYIHMILTDEFGEVDILELTEDDDEDDEDDEDDDNDERLATAPA